MKTIATRKLTLSTHGQRIDKELLQRPDYTRRLVDLVNEYEEKIKAQILCANHPRVVGEMLEELSGQDITVQDLVTQYTGDSLKKIFNSNSVILSLNNILGETLGIQLRDLSSMPNSNLLLEGAIIYGH